MTHPEYKPTPVVMAINEIAFHGNIIPLSWFHHLQYDNGKPNLAAIIILSDVIYWYRPQEQRDEETGEFVGWKSKFRGDMLQRSYDQLSDRLGITKIQAKNAIDYLIEAGVLKREFRTITTNRGIVLNNRMFLEPIPKGIKKINEMPAGSRFNPSRLQSEEGISTPERGGPPHSGVNTCTESTSSTEISLTTETSKNGINQSSMSAEPKKDEQPPTGMDGWMDDCYKNPNFIFLRDCGVMNDGVAKELMVLARSTLEYQWALVKKSTIEDIGKPGLLVSNLRKVLAAEAAKQQAAAERAANPETAQMPASVHPDALRYQRPDFITEAEWYGLRDVPEAYDLLHNAALNEDGSIECERFQKTTALYMKHDGLVIQNRFAACVAARHAWQLAYADGSEQ